MLNIRFRGKYTDETQLINDTELPTGANQFKESKTLIGAFIRGTIIILPLIISMVIISVLKIRKLTNDFEVDLSFGITFVVMLLLGYLLTYLHEFIHALLYPKNAVKEIWKDTSQGAYFVYCSSVVSKTRFIVICLAPVILLGIIPYGIWLLIYHVLPINISICFAILTWIMTLMSVGDFYNVYNTVLQVPNKSKIFNYGLHSYWTRC